MLQNTADSANREKSKGNSYIVRSKRHAEYLYRHTVVKNSWKGKYPRVLCIAKTHVATLQPDSLFRVTNKWSFGVNFIDVVPDPQSPTQLILLFNKNSTVEKFSFSALNASERAEILTDIQRQRAFFDRNQSQKRGEVFPVKKRKSDDSFEDVVFEVAASRH
ncbi:hypothetical protein ADEAN_000554100 [Angomonas deanei]|uniref:DnaJ homologue subfamily C GRV2/DNAJC13 N-terminal domain-containing protein n=1 Tax=Angomonas deanei TaxID=59799 RepID=A0A7G2CFE3_9TRYP|nr:hypothetical protein ADEAN_000554100 [Angomonas deanei]